jgi:hypothetical protein
MSKELNLVDTLENHEVATQTELVKLDDLSLALVGGGQCAVDI